MMDLAPFSTHFPHPMPPSRPLRCRYAPSPTGSLHLGNARTALLAYLQARSMKADFVLRIEDIDLPRTVERATEAILEDLRWLGIRWDEGPDVPGGTVGPYVQSQRLGLYDEFLERLKAMGAVYECYCSRSDILRASSAPHPGEEGPVYPGTCRNLPESRREERRKALAKGRVGSWRVDVQDAPPIRFHDQVLGDMEYDLKRQVGDFVLKRADGLFAYQLVAAVDDALMGITHVLRGDDLVSSTPRQLFLMDVLGLPRPDAYAHVPLLLEADGTKLSKRMGSMTVSSLRERGIPPERIVAALARSAGLTDRDEAMPDDLLAGFSLDRVKRRPSMLSPGWMD